MIIYLVVLFGLSLHSVWGHEGAPDADDIRPNRQSSMRFANIDILSRDEQLIQLFLYRSADDEGTLISPDKPTDVIDELNPQAKTYVLFNGHPSSDSTEPYEKLRAALFAEADANIIFVYIDWTKHQITFKDALGLAESFGQYIGDTLQALGIPISNLHFIGHCAGAEIATSVANRLSVLGREKVPRLTAFDPYVSNSTRLAQATSLIDFVDVYHAGIYDPPFAPVGHVDFYPNAGIRQPGCAADGLLSEFVCHHRRSIYLYAESITSQVNAVEATFDPENQDLLAMTGPSLAQFGHLVDPSSSGAYYLPTTGASPYLINYF